MRCFDPFPERLTALTLATTLLLGYLSALTTARGQSPIAADRPGLGTESATVLQGRVQAELGYSFAEEEGTRLHNFGELLLRYGVTSGFELRGGVGSYGLVVDPPMLEGGYKGANVGTKIRLYDGSLTTLSGVATLSLPTETRGFDTDDNRARQTLVLALDAALGTSLSLLLNAGSSFYYTGEDTAAEGLLTSTLGIDLDDNMGAYVGYGGFYNTGANRNFVEGGLTYLATPNVQLDLNSGLQVDEVGRDFFAGLGLAFRF